MSLDNRKQQILKAVVQYHVRTAEPVSSGDISSIPGLGVKSATVRNEMAAMSDLGYLTQPHTSAGRIPSDTGYRFFVDRLMARRSYLPHDTQQEPDRVLRERTAVDDVIGATCRILSAITQLTALATVPTSGSIRLRWMDIRRIGPNQVLLLTLWSNGQLRQATLEAPRVSDALIRRLLQVLDDTISGQTAEQIQAFELPPDLHIPREARQLVLGLQESMKAVARDASAPEVFVDGTSWFARQPEFADRAAIELVLSVLDESSTMAQLLQAAAVGEDPQVLIGRENPVEPLRSCSIVAGAYRTRSGMSGSVGVCGPTRMDYERAVAAVRYVIQAVSSALDSMLPA